MMSSGRSGSSGMVPRNKRKRGEEAGPYIMLAVVAVLVVIIILVVALSGGRRGGGSGVAREGRRSSTEVSASAQTTARGKTERSSTKLSRRERRRKESRLSRREQRQRERKERSYATRSTRRSDRGGYTLRKSGRPVLRAIISHPSGERIAVVGERQVRRGDQIEGRRIIEVGPDWVKVEYFTKSYEVKLNQPLY